MPHYMIRLHDSSCAESCNGLVESFSVLQCAAVCCIVLQCLQCAAVCCRKRCSHGGSCKERLPTFSRVTFEVATVGRID